MLNKDDQRRTCVRFTRKQYLKIKRDSINAGKTIPVLLKEAYKKNPIPIPRFYGIGSQYILNEMEAIREESEHMVLAINHGTPAEVGIQIEILAKHFREIREWMSTHKSISETQVVRTDDGL